MDEILQVVFVIVALLIFAWSGTGLSDTLRGDDDKERG